MAWSRILIVMSLISLGQAQSCEHGQCELGDNIESESGSAMLQTQRLKLPPAIVLSDDAQGESADVAAPSRAIDNGESHDAAAPARAIVEGESVEEETTSSHGDSEDVAESVGQGESEDGEENKEGMVSQKNLDMQFAMDQPLTEEGWRNVQSHCCMYLLDMYSRRVIADLGLDICAESCHSGFFPNFHCLSPAGATLEEYKTRIIDSQTDKCWCFAPQGQCQLLEGSGPGARPARNCSEFERPGAPVNPNWHRRRRCGTAATTTTTTGLPGATTTTTTTIPSSDRLCALPAAVHDYSLITLNDAVVSAHEIYKGLAIGGTLTDGTPSESGNVGSHGGPWPSFAKKKIGGKWNFQGGYSNGELSDVFDWSQFEWLARHAEWLLEGGTSPVNSDYVVRVFKEGGTYSADGQPSWGLNFQDQGEDNGKTLMVFRTNEDIRITSTSYDRQYGPSILAPFSVVTLDGNAGFADGFIIAKQFGPSGTYPSEGSNPGGLQLHGDGYKGPMKCTP